MRTRTNTTRRQCFQHVLGTYGGGRFAVHTRPIHDKYAHTVFSTVFVLCFAHQFLYPARGKKSARAPPRAVSYSFAWRHESSWSSGTALASSRHTNAQSSMRQWMFLPQKKAATSERMVCAVRRLSTCPSPRPWLDRHDKRVRSEGERPTASAPPHSINGHTLPIPVLAIIVSWGFAFWGFVLGFNRQLFWPICFFSLAFSSQSSPPITQAFRPDQLFQRIANPTKSTKTTVDLLGFLCTVHHIEHQMHVRSNSKVPGIVTNMTIHSQMHSITSTTCTTKSNIQTSNTVATQTTRPDPRLSPPFLCLCVHHENGHYDHLSRAGRNPTSATRTKLAYMGRPRQRRHAVQSDCGISFCRLVTTP